MKALFKESLYVFCGLQRLTCQTRTLLEDNNLPSLTHDLPNTDKPFKELLQCFWCRLSWGFWSFWWSHSTKMCYPKVLEFKWINQSVHLRYTDLARSHQIFYIPLKVVPLHFKAIFNFNKTFHILGFPQFWMIPCVCAHIYIYIYISVCVCVYFFFIQRLSSIS